MFINIVIYADDIVILAENENDLQLMLDCLCKWCRNNNIIMLKVMRYILELCLCKSLSLYLSVMIKYFNMLQYYTYLAITLNEFLDYNVTAKFVSQAARRALGLMIAKAIDGMSFHVYTKLFDTLVWPVIAYGAAIWDTRQFSCIDTIQYRAMRFFMGTGKYTPNLAVAGDMGWEPIFF